ncbi:MAG: hypothetical protein ABIE22_02920 [archaeon]
MAEDNLLKKIRQKSESKIFNEIISALYHPGTIDTEKIGLCKLPTSVRE